MAGGPTLARFEVIRLADNLDDQKTAAQISLAIPSSVSEEDYQVFFLSRLREIIFGEPNGDRWYDDFQASGILPLKNVALRKVGASLTGLLDGTNRSFTTSDKFVHNPAFGQTIEVWHNGRRLMQSSTPDPRFGDYYVSESGGAGTGFDTVNLLTFSPIEGSCLVADYNVL